MSISSVNKSPHGGGFSIAQFPVSKEPSIGEASSLVTRTSSAFVDAASSMSHEPQEKDLEEVITQQAFLGFLRPNTRACEILHPRAGIFNAARFN